MGLGTQTLLQKREPYYGDANLGIVNVNLGSWTRTLDCGREPRGRGREPCDRGREPYYGDANLFTATRPLLEQQKG